MKTRLHKIEITNFKAFREFSLNLECSHLLYYGPNGPYIRIKGSNANYKDA